MTSSRSIRNKALLTGAIVLLLAACLTSASDDQGPVTWPPEWEGQPGPGEDEGPEDGGQPDEEDQGEQGQGGSGGGGAGPGGAGLAASAWPRFQGGAAATGLSKVAGPARATVRWGLRMGGWLSSPVLGADGTIYFGHSSGQFLAYDSSGREKWSFAPPVDPVTRVENDSGLSQIDRLEMSESARVRFATHAAAVAADGTIYFGVTFEPRPFDNNLGAWYRDNRDRLGVFALAPDGRLKWFHATNEDVTSSPNIGADGTIYVATASRLVALAPDGRLRWDHPLDGGVAWSSPAIAPDGTIYVVDRALRALRPDGSLKWSYQGAAPSEGFAAHPTVGADGTVFYGTSSILYAVTPEGRQRWVRDIGWTESSPALGPGNRLYIGTASLGGKEAGFHAIDTDTGAIVWSFPIQSAVDSSPAVGANGRVYVGTDDGFFYALNPDGSVSWKIDMGMSAAEPGERAFPGEVDTAPAIGSDGTLYFGQAGGPMVVDRFDFYAIGQGGAAPASTPDTSGDGQRCRVGNEVGVTCSSREACSTGEWIQGCCIQGVCRSGDGPFVR